MLSVKKFDPMQDVLGWFELHRSSARGETVWNQSKDVPIKSSDEILVKVSLLEIGVIVVKEEPASEKGGRLLLLQSFYIHVSAQQHGKRESILILLVCWGYLLSSDLWREDETPLILLFECTNSTMGKLNFSLINYDCPNGCNHRSVCANVCKILVINELIVM